MNRFLHTLFFLLITDPPLPFLLPITNLSFRSPIIAIVPCNKQGIANHIGTAARVIKVTKQRRAGVNTYTLLLEGVCRYQYNFDVILYDVA